MSEKQQNDNALINSYLDTRIVKLFKLKNQTKQTPPFFKADNPVKMLLLVAMSKFCSAHHIKCCHGGWWRLLPFVSLINSMTWFSGSSSYCCLLTVPLLTSKTFGFVWGINCYYNIVQACCRDQFEYSFSFFLLPIYNIVQWWERRSACCAWRHVCHPCRWLF